MSPREAPAAPADAVSREAAPDESGSREAAPDETSSGETSSGETALGETSSRGDLARRQSELVQALVAGGRAPAGFDTGALDATRSALLRKRAEEVARTWPRLAAAAGPGRWTSAFAVWAAGRPPQGSLRDGWDYARAHPPRDAAAARELALRELLWAYDGASAPRPRRGPALRLHAGVLLLRWRGHAHQLHRPLR